MHTLLGYAQSKKLTAKKVAIHSIEYYSHHMSENSSEHIWPTFLSACSRALRGISPAQPAFHKSLWTSASKITQIHSTVAEQVVHNDSNESSPPSIPFAKDMTSYFWTIKNVCMWKASQIFRDRLCYFLLRKLTTVLVLENHHQDLPLLTTSETYLQHTRHQSRRHTICLVR